MGGMSKRLGDWDSEEIKSINKGEWLRKGEREQIYLQSRSFFCTIEFVFACCLLLLLPSSKKKKPKRNFFSIFSSLLLLLSIP
jgi:hypothetical protein